MSVGRRPAPRRTCERRSGSPPCIAEEERCKSGIAWRAGTNLPSVPVRPFSQFFYARGFRSVADRSHRCHRPRKREIQSANMAPQARRQRPGRRLRSCRRRNAAAKRQGAGMTDYRVSKLFFDLQHDPKLAAEYRADMPAVLDRYEIKPLVNAYLLRFYFQIRGMPQAEFIARLHALKPKEGAHG